MHDQVAELVRQGEQLSLEDRERVVEALLASLNMASVGELHPAWESEIGRRLSEYDAGEVQAIDEEEVFARVRQAAGE